MKWNEGSPARLAYYEGKVRTKFECPNCHKGIMIWVSNITLTSNPPQYDFYCDTCGKHSYRWEPPSQDEIEESDDKTQNLGQEQLFAFPEKIAGNLFASPEKITENNDALYINYTVNRQKEENNGNG